MQTIWARERKAKGGRRKKTSRRVTLSCRMLSVGGDSRPALLQDEQMAQSKCADLLHISIPCCRAVDVGFFFVFHLLQMLSYRMGAMFKLMRSGRCFVFLFIPSSSLPPAHPPACLSPSFPRSEHKPICQTIMKRSAGRLQRRQSGERWCQAITSRCGEALEKLRLNHG